MLGVLVNVAAVLLGATVGLLFKKGIPERLTKTVMTGVALCVLYIGISGALKGENTLVAIVSIAVGALLGELIDIDRRLNRLGEKLQARFRRPGEQSAVAEGFVSASLLFCVGAMAIVGSLNAGLTGDNEMLFTKSLLDGISSVVFAASLGFGVYFSCLAVLVYQGAIVLLANFVAPYLSDYAIGEMTCVGSLLIIALGLNMLGVTKIKVANLLPAILLPILLCLFM